MDKRLRLLHNLYCFETAARHLSYSKAAQELFISQAAVSQQMRNLESSLNVSLFTRSGRNMLLSYEGERLFQACQKGFSEIIEGLNAIQHQDESGDLTITSTQAFCSLWIMPNLFDFSVKHPDINVKVLGSNQLEDLRQKHIDLAIRFSTSTPVVATRDLVIECIGEDPIYPVCSACLASSNNITSPEHLLNQRLISLADSSVSWQAWFDRLKIKGFANHTKKTEVTSSDLALSAVLNGHGVMFATTTMIKPFIASGQLVIPFRIQHPTVWKTYLMYQRHSSKRKRIEAFCNWVKATLILR